MEERKKRKLITIYLFVFMEAFALSSTMFSTVLPKIIEDYSLSLSQAGLFTVCTSIGNLFAMLLTGLIGDRMKKSRFTGIIFVAMGLMLLGISLAPSFAELLVLMTLLGICTSALNLMVTAYVSDLYGEMRSRYINLLHVCFGIGSLLGPLYPMFLGRFNLAWRYSYLGLAAFVLLVGGGYFVRLARNGEPASMGASVSKESASAPGVRTLMGYKGMLALCAMSFLYMGGHQGAFSTWLQTYLQDIDPQLYPETFTSVCMTIYWIGMVVSRLIGAVLPSKIAPRTVLLTGSLMGVAFLSWGLAVGQRNLWPIAAALLGVSTGVIYPLTFAISCAWFPDGSARASSFVGIFSSLGSITFGYIMGRVAERSFQMAMWIPVCVLMTVFLIVLLHFPKRGAEKPAS